MARVAAGGLGVLIGLPVAACFVKPSPPEATVDAHVNIDSTGSSVVEDASINPGLCTSYEFTGPVAAGCGGWATQLGQTANAGNGNLTLAVAASTVSVGSTTCLTQPQSSTSITVNLTSFGPDNGYTDLSVFATVGGARYEAVISGQHLAQTIGVRCDMAVAIPATWELGSGRFVRLAWTSSTRLNAEVAATAGGPFIPVGSCDVALTTDHAFGIELERGSAGSTQQAEINSVEICP